ncbi:hypothetical protein GQ53DRAFT_855387 [Thozetella sp. PMI_491]|nr:hypothetical protein GQ53DRAFT_855387 [Thozetella sp. PMI_491]
MSFSIIGAGDVVLNGPLRRPTGSGTVYDHLRTADSCFVNLEMPFTKHPAHAEKLITLKCDPVHTSVLTDLQIDVVTVANNHGMDFGEEGLRETIQALGSAGIAHCGGGRNRSESFAPVIKEIDGTKVAYIGVTTTLPNGSGAGPARPGLAGVRVFTKYVIDSVTIDESPGMAPFVETATYKQDEELLLAAIRDARTKASVVLVGIHWGVPYGWVAFTQSEIATYQRPLAHAMVDAGASAIFGHHPHVVHGVEFHKGVPVFYSLGNFIFSNDIVEPTTDLRTYPPYDWSSLQLSLSNIGALAKLRWSQGKLSCCSIVPITIAVEGGEPLDATANDAEVLLARLRSLSKDQGAAFSLVSGNRYEIIVKQTE